MRAKLKSEATVTRTKDCCWRRAMAVVIVTWGMVGVLELMGQAVRPGATGTAGRTGLSTEPRQYRSSTMLGDAVIEIDPETRSLIIITDEATHENIGQVIKNLDRPKPQVLIKVMFLEVTHNKGLDIGLEGTYTYTHDGINEGSASTVWGLAQQVDGGFWRVLADDWQTTLRAIAQRGKLEVLSRPSILARNNQEAVIVVGEEIPFVTNSRITDAGQTINTIQYADIGIILRVTPFITSEDMVEMIVAPEISTLTDRTIPISETVSSPVIAKRSAETVVVTPNGRTVVIGGLMETQKTESVRKVPILGDVPLLGLAFRRTIRDEVKKELLIFLTPYIVNDPEGLEALSRREVDNTRLAPKAFSREVVDQHLEGTQLHGVRSGD
jgi:general secretion pathway protein D